MAATTLRMALELFSPRGKWLFGGVLALVTAMAFLETFAVVSVMPFISLVANPEAVDDFAVLRFLHDALGFEGTHRFLVFTGMLVFGVILASNAFSALTNWAIQRFVWSRQAELSVRLLGRYLHQPYLYFLTENTSRLSKNLLSQVNSVTNGVLMPGMWLLARGAVALALLILLLVVDWFLALVVAGVVGVLYGVLFLAVRKLQSRLGEEKVKVAGLRYRISSEAFAAIKELKLLGREDELLRRFAEPAHRYARNQGSSQVVSQLPRYAVEAVAFGGILIILIYLLAAQGNVTEILPMASLYAFAGYKLLPAVQNVFHSLNAMRFNRAALEELHRDLVGDKGGEGRAGGANQNVGGAPPGTDPTDRADAGTGEASIPGEWSEIRLRDLTFHYPGAHEPAVEGVSLEIPRGSITGFVGATGSGKTTLVDLILGLLAAQGGTIQVGGVPVGPGNLRDWQRRLGYVPQEIVLSDDTVERNVAFGLPDDRVDGEAVRRAARQARIHDFVEGLPQGYETVVGERGVRLSGGQRQRIGLARALYHSPEVLVLDEATSALDMATEAEVIREILAERDSATGAEPGGSVPTVIMVAHRLATVRRCDAIHVLEEGRLAGSGTYDELMESSGQFREMALRGSEEEARAR